MPSYPKLPGRSVVPSNKSEQSPSPFGTGQSKVSTASIDSAPTINSVHSLMSLASRISDDLYPQEKLVASLLAWLETVDPVVYKEETPWSPELVAN